MKKSRPHCENCGVYYPGHVALLEEDGRCCVCQSKYESDAPSTAKQRCESMADHLRKLCVIYERSLLADLGYRDGILRQLEESLGKLKELDSELKSLGR